MLRITGYGWVPCYVFVSDSIITRSMLMLLAKTKNTRAIRSIFIIEDFLYSKIAINGEVTRCVNTAMYEMLDSGPSGFVLSKYNEIVALKKQKIAVNASIDLAHLFSCAAKYLFLKCTLNLSLIFIF